jgi:hypothetical protein
VVTVESPGAPGVEALLLRSGRVLEASWVAARQAGAARGEVAIELVRRGLIGAAELEAVCLLALYDATFAMAAGTVEQCAWEPSDATPHCWTSTVTAVDADVLRAEAERRLAALSQSAVTLRPGRDRLAAEPVATAHGRRPSGLRGELLGLANGRRTARDIAFLLGRSVYPVTVEAARLLAERLLRIETPGEDGAEVRALLAPRHAAPTAPPATGPVRLPRRPARASGS